VYRHAVVLTPEGSLGRIARGTAYSNRFPVRQRLRPSPSYGKVGVHIGRFEACSTFTRVTACLLAASPQQHMCLEGSDGFVTSTATPIATRWSDPVAGWDLHPLKTNTFARRTLVASPFVPPVWRAVIALHDGDGSLAAWSTGQMSLTTSPWARTKRVRALIPVPKTAW
jgi:hypothetical protein